MVATPLIIGEAQIRALAKLRQVASDNPLNMPAVVERLKTPQGKEAHMRQMDDQSVQIPIGFLVTFSIEVGHPIGTCRHMSMSSPRAGRLPTQEAVWMVAEHLGFVTGVEACRIWLEDLQRDAAGRKAQAVNLVQPLAMAEAAHA